MRLQDQYTKINYISELAISNIENEILKISFTITSEEYNT